MTQDLINFHPGVESIQNAVNKVEDKMEAAKEKYEKVEGAAAIAGGVMEGDVDHEKVIE